LNTFPIQSTRTPSRSGFSLANGASLLMQRSARKPRMNATLKSLFADIAIRTFAADGATRVACIATDSRRVSPGCMFFAINGRSHRGADYVDQAVERGAAVIVAEEAVWVPRKTGLIVVDDARRVLAEVARRFYGDAQKSVPTIGVTGTSGKTVVASLARYFLETQGPVGLLGTIHYVLGERTLPAYRTTPEPVELHAMFAQMREAGCTRAVMEISSHGIDQERVTGLPLETAVFLNLHPEHLDYHGSIDAYFATMASLFSGERGPVPRNAVINVEDPWGQRLQAQLPAGCKPVTFGIGCAADFRADNLECDAKGSRFDLSWPGGSARVASPLIGRFNVSNVLAALAVASLCGLDPLQCAARLIDFEGVRGRMESVVMGQPYSVVIDYAHTEESYRQALAMLRTITPGRILTVFGCGGNRDPRKRPGITRAVLDGSDCVFITSDNPRGEQIATIFADMRPAVRADDPVSFIEDRRHAISLALDEAQPGDTVLIAGKGHETYQEYADSVVPFDDRAVARDLLARKLGQDF